MAAVGYTTYKYMAKPNASMLTVVTSDCTGQKVSLLAIFTEKPFFEEALLLTRGYKPIREKLGEPLQPLKVDTSNAFNVLTLLGAQVSVI